jgi:hypothetical protein
MKNDRLLDDIDRDLIRTARGRVIAPTATDATPTILGCRFAAAHRSVDDRFVRTP